MLALFAVAANANTGNLDEESVTIAAVVGGGVFVWLLLSVFFLNTLSNALKRCRPMNQLLDPGRVWLNLIPVFNILWLFVTVIRVGDSLRAEFRSRGREDTGTCGKTLGITFAVFNALNFGCIIAGLIPLVLLVVYWVTITGYTRELSRYENVSEDDDRRPGGYEDARPENEGDGRPDRRDDVYGDRWEVRRDRHENDERGDRR